MTLDVEKAKQQLVNMGQTVLRAGLVVGTWGNLSYRVPRDDVMVITPSGMDYERLQPRDMVVLDMEGMPVEGHRKPSTEGSLHLAVYRARPDVRAVIHTHSPYASAMAVARRGIPPILEDLVSMVGGGVPVAKYAPAGSARLAEVAATVLTGIDAVLLANHGVVAVGRSLREAFLTSQVVEQAARIYIYAQMVDRPVALDEGEVKKLRTFYRESYGQQKGDRE